LFVKRPNGLICLTLETSPHGIKNFFHKNWKDIPFSSASISVSRYAIKMNAGGDQIMHARKIPTANNTDERLNSLPIKK
jgi:hypothetical protein